MEQIKILSELVLGEFAPKCIIGDCKEKIFAIVDDRPMCKRHFHMIYDPNNFYRKSITIFPDSKKDVELFESFKRDEKKLFRTVRVGDVEIGADAILETLKEVKENLIMEPEHAMVIDALEIHFSGDDEDEMVGDDERNSERSEDREDSNRIYA